MVGKQSAVYRIKRRAIGRISPRWRAIARDVIKFGVSDTIKKATRKKKRLARIRHGREMCESIASYYSENREQLLKDFPL